ncbi:MAG: hypothetical protein Q8873_09285, partial [Bacillota bacterium]|nr:hypothetical protein [Bacillota bacterium]
GVISAIAGAVIYQLLVAVVVRYQIFGVNSSDLKSLTIAAIMAIVLALPSFKDEIKTVMAKRGSVQNAGN